MAYRNPIELDPKFAPVKFMIVFVPVAVQLLNKFFEFELLLPLQPNAKRKIKDNKYRMVTLHA